MCSRSEKKLTRNSAHGPATIALPRHASCPARHGPVLPSGHTLESDHSLADDYYLKDGTTLASFTVTDGTGEVRATAQLDAEAYAGWVDWGDPLTRTSMGMPRLPGEERTSKHGC